MTSVITVENLSKKYIINHQKQLGNTSFREVLTQGASRAIGRLIHPFKKKESKLTHEEFWALKDVSFDIQQGDRVGIIGRNGAGKSTLLKILSRITEPTSGKISIKGRVASLLEVGTGFHPELTGRENIFLNGAILGMSRVEIKKKFDEIVAFAEVEKFLDTPVKHYSSGMYVRLAFAVAAHLEPEILILDEVLAVGDAQFQKKCLGKMNEVAGEGRTVIFVSHSMGSVAEICSRAIMLKDGQVVISGNTRTVIEHYMDNAPVEGGGLFLGKDIADKDISVASAKTVKLSGEPIENFIHDEPITIIITCAINRWIENSVMGFFIRDLRERKIFTTINPEWSVAATVKGELTMTAVIPPGFLVPGKYFITLAISVPGGEVLDWVDDALAFTVIDGGSEFSRYEGGDYGCVFPNCQWHVGANTQ